MIGATLALQLAFDRVVSDLWVSRPPSSLPTDVLIGVSIGLAFVVATQWAGRHLRAFRDMAAALGELLRFMSPKDVPAQAFSSALAEELLFRGFLQPLLGLHGTAILFGLVHGVRDRRLRWWPPIGVLLGYILGLLFESRGNLLAPFLVHLTINWFNLHYVLEREPSPTP